MQQLAWNVYAETEDIATDSGYERGVTALMEQCNAFFMQQTGSLSTYQMNMLRAISNGIHKNFTSREVLNVYKLGTKSNVLRLQSALISKELIEKRENGLYFTDPILARWFKHNS